MKTAFVTGASAGFGKAICRALIADNYRVIGGARRADKLAELERELGEHFIALPLDVTDAASLDAACESIRDASLHIDLLVNNAGLALGIDRAQSADAKNWERMIATNVTGLAMVTHKLLPSMVEANKGLIINIGSIAGTYPYPGGNVYGATKAFVHQFSLNLRSDLHGTGVRVTCIEPGLCGGTEFSVVRFGGDQARASAVYAGVDPLTADDVAASVHWAASQPAHVNINTIELMPVAQSFGAFQVHRRA